WQPAPLPDVAVPADALQHLLHSAARGLLLLAVFSSPASAAAPHIRVDVRPVRLKGSTALQFAARTTTQEFHSNLSLADAVLHLQQLADGRFRNIRIVTSHGETQAVAAKNGRWKLHQKLSSPTSPPATDT
ncbi:MAG: hypothetical protein ACK5YO_21795, partial [Planctomyces sp.]